MIRVLLDTNVLIDVLQKRQPWFAFSKEIFTAAANQDILGYITAKQAGDLYFFACKQLRGEADIDKKARKILNNLFALFIFSVSVRANKLNSAYCVIKRLYAVKIKGDIGVYRNTVKDSLH